MPDDNRDIANAPLAEQPGGEAGHIRDDQGESAESAARRYENAGKLEQALQAYKLAADKARQAYLNEAAVQSYSRALTLVGEHAELAEPSVEYELLAGREDCHRRLGDRRAQQADLDAMARIAQQTNDAARQAQATIRQAALANLLGQHAEALQAAEAALALAGTAGDRKLEADSLTALGEASYRLGNHERTVECHERALDLYRERGDRAGEANSLHLLGRVAYRAGQLAQVQDYYTQALAIYRNLRDREGEATVLNALGVAAADRAQARNYYEQSLSIARSIGDRAGQSRAYNNLALIYWNLGLYGKARDYLEQAVQIEREMGGRSSLAYFLESLGRVYLELEAYGKARQVLHEGLALSIESGDRWSESGYWLGLGREALAKGHLDEARESIQKACDMQRALGTLGDLASSLAWLGAAYLAAGKWEQAQRCTAEAVTQLEAAGSSGDYAPQDVWWMRYQVLKFAPGDGDTRDEESWACLQRARDSMLASISTLSDDGLRRSCLNKVKTNASITVEWARLMAARQRSEGHPLLDSLVLPPLQRDAATAVKDQLRRVLDISLQMNETRNAESLHEYVLDQVIELSGAERGFLILIKPDGRMNFEATRGFEPDEIKRARAQSSYTVISTVAQSRLPILLQDIPTDLLSGRHSSVLELNLRSVMCVPLLARSALVGLIYADNRSVSGRFLPSDLDLLTMFANQAATAIENARLYEETVAWTRTLEQRVAERTAELQRANKILVRRAAQLETSREVAQQVTLILDLDKLLRQVVKLIQTRFGYYCVSAWLVTDKRDAVSVCAVARRDIDPGQTMESSIPMTSSSIIVSVCKTGQYRLVNDVKNEPDYMAVDTLPDTRAELAVPLQIGQTVTGVLDIQSDQTDSFEPDDVVALQTLANQIAISIRNVQLYEGEQRRRRLAESLEQAGRELSSSLDVTEVLGHILDQLATVVPYERCGVVLEQGATMKFSAHRGFPDDERVKDLRIVIREGDVYQQMIETHSHVLIDDVTREAAWKQVEWLPLNKSWLGIPLIAKDRVVAMISMTRREAGAFSAEDALLASTFAGQAAIALENAKLYSELNQAYRNLERLDKTKSDFINVAAHELRTPLTVIKGYTQVLQVLPIGQDPQSKPMLDGILTGMARMHEVVNSILDITKIDAQALRLSKDMVVLANTLQRIQAELTDALQERHLTLSTQGLNSLPFIHADPALLYKAFHQLVINAIKYTPDGGAITVSGTAVDDETFGEGVELIVQDTGIGIDPAHHELIFEKFYQTGEVAVHSSGRTKFKGGGPGLGLAIVKGIVVAHGGRVWVESEYHDEKRCPGSRFYVRLPVK
ncbi:MAG: GAF domain-containing protein [Thermoflexales bacterium]|nr:GAF domain-containing protein [Thermoflexales bacterium]